MKSRFCGVVGRNGGVVLAAVAAMALQAIGGATILDDAKSAGKGAMLLAYGSDWSKAGRAVCATYQSGAFKKAVDGRYVTGLLDVREKPTPESEKAGKWAAPADLASFRLPALFLVGPNGRGFLALENISITATAEELAGNVREAERVREQAESLVAEAEKLTGEAAAEKIGAALELLEPLLGGTERLLGKQCYGSVFNRLKELDPEDATSWQRRFTMGSGVNLIAEVNAAREKGDFEKGEKTIAREAAKSSRHLTLNQRQALEMMRFALYRTVEERKDENIKLLDSIASQDHSTLWGMAAVGFLRRFHAPEAAKYLKPPAERQILRPRGAAAEQAPAFDFDATLAADLRALDGLDLAGLESISPARRESLVRAYILVSAGKDAAKRIQALEGGARFLGAFFADRAWMESFAGSGPWHYGADSALELLDLMAWNESGVYTNSFLRNAATAFSMNFSVTNPPPGGVVARLPKGTGAPPPMPNDEALVRTLQLFKKFSDAGRLHDSVYGLDVYEWRYLLFPWERNDPEDLAALNSFCNTTMDKTRRLGFKVPYRLRSCFGESIHKPEFYQPWLHEQSRFITSPEIGGVCGMISSFSTTLCHSHGMMAVTAGQPGHCAFVMRPARGDERQWKTFYYIQPYTGARFGVFKWGGYQNLLAAEALYTGVELQAREHARWLAAVRRATRAEGMRAAEEKESFDGTVAALYMNSMENAAGNWPAGREWCDYLKASGAPESAWTNYVDTVLKTTAGNVPILGELMKPFFDRLSAPGKARELDAAVERMICAARLPAQKRSEYPNYSTLLDIASNRVGKKSSKRLFRIYSKVLAGLSTQDDYFMQAFAWGAKRYVGRPRLEDEYMNLVTRVLENASGDGMTKGDSPGPKIVLRRLIRQAEDAADRERLDKVLAIMKKIFPPAPFPANAKAFPAADFGGELISSNAFVQVSLNRADSRDRAERHQELCDASPLRGQRAGTPVMANGASGATWVRLQLLGDSEVKGILIVNTRMKKNREKQLPMRVEVSADGKTWLKVAEFDKPADSWRIPLDGSHGRVKFVRASTDGALLTNNLSLLKFLVYGRKLH